MKNPKLRRLKKRAIGPKDPKRFTDWGPDTLRVIRKPPATPKKD